MTTANKVLVQTPEFVEVEMEIKNIPFLAETLRKDKNGASVYDVPEGMSVLTTSTDGEGVRWARIESLTVEDGCSLRKVVTSAGKEVTVSANESMAAFDPMLGLKKVEPDKLENCLVPTILERPCGSEGTFELGWLLGFWLSDGNINASTLILTKADDATRNMFLQVLGKITGNDSLVEVARTYQEMHIAEANCGIGGLSKKFHLNLTHVPADIVDMLRNCYPQDLDWSSINASNRSCLYKQLPPCVRNWNKDALLGLLCGLITGDGSVSVNRSKAKPQLLVMLNTSSVQLRDDIIWLGSCLGFRMKYSTTKATPGRTQTHDSYSIPVSTPVLRRYKDKLLLPPVYDEAIALLEEVKENTKDIVPISYNVADAVWGLSDEQRAGITKSAAATLKSQAKKAATKYTSLIRANAEKYAEVVERHVLVKEDLDATLRQELELFCSVTRDISTGWEKIASVEEVPTETVYDIAVPATKVFALANGLVVFDTINVHVPASPAAVKETKEKLMPSTFPFSNRNQDSLVPLPKQEQVLGLYTAATAPSTPPVDFPSEEAALQAIRSGQIPLSADITIRGKA